MVGGGGANYNYIFYFNLYQLVGLSIVHLVFPVDS